jgi:hypothetical protein
MCRNECLLTLAIERVNVPRTSCTAPTPVRSS